MTKRWVVLLFVLPLIGADEPAGYKYWSAGELKAKGKALGSKINEQKVALERLADLGNHYALLAHREGRGEAEYHETEADLFVIESGTATIVVGGKIQNGKTTAPGEIRGTSIDGGMLRRVGVGDVIHIAPKTPHQVLLDSNKQFTYFVLKVKE